MSMDYDSMWARGTVGYGDGVSYPAEGKTVPYFYQSGPKEGQIIPQRAIDFLVEALGYGIVDRRWGNDHDTMLEHLADAYYQIQESLR